MQFFILVLLICLFMYLFCVYSLVKDDYVLFRKDISMERLFNMVFVGSLLCLFSARLFYGILHAKSILLNPFVFLLFPYFPGLSLLGGVVGAGVYFLFLATRKKNILPLGRIFDFFSISFLVTLPVGFFGYFLFSEEKISIQNAFGLIIVYSVLSIVFLKLFLPRLMSGKFREGTIAILFVIFFSAISLISNAIEKFSGFVSLQNPENIILMVILLASIFYLIRRENI